MAFMKPDIQRGAYYEIDTTAGTEIVPASVCPRAETAGDLRPYLEGHPTDSDEKVELKEGWLARLSASGYIDCTDWSAHKTEQDAVEYLKTMYGYDEESEDA